jgi:hypothetical protein
MQGGAGSSGLLSAKMGAGARSLSGFSRPDHLLPLLLLGLHALAQRAAPPGPEGLPSDLPNRHFVASGLEHLAGLPARGSFCLGFLAGPLLAEPVRVFGGRNVVPVIRQTFLCSGRFHLTHPMSLMGPDLDRRARDRLRMLGDLCGSRQHGGYGRTYSHTEPAIWLLS